MSLNTVKPIDTTIREAGRSLLERSPTLEPFLVTARDRYARTRVRLRTLANSIRYAAPPEPYRLIQIDPSEVGRGVELGVSKYVEAGKVVGGEWEGEWFTFGESDVYQAYEAHFQDGVPWEETAFYARIVGELESGKVRWGCRTETEFQDRCDRLERLYERLQTEGYRSQAELLADGGDNLIQFGRRSHLLTERLKDEIAIHIDRRGELIFSDGRNRLSMAKLIGLDSVTVRVLRRHADWQAIRDAYVRGEPWTKAYADHPDIAYLEFGSKPAP
ncbi:hypothetical protein [Halobaculum limi]|uniref:hypothetical protein n=1 Tax=Halobaculum limi TaxID=3031916 RepID=UPI002405A74C|nr:hypothetical protein [Halobaculum sp. YSMS11]